MEEKLITEEQNQKEQLRQQLIKGYQAQVKNIREKVLCLKCLGEFQAKMSASKKCTFSKYLKRGY